MVVRRAHPNVRLLVSDGTEFEETARFLPIEPGEQAFRAGVRLTNSLYESACQIADAFLLACSGEYMQPAMATLLPGGWTGLAVEMAKGIAKDLLWIVGGAGIGASFGAALGTLLPPAEPLTLAGGAALGAAIATWALLGIGIVMAGKMVIQLSNATCTLFGAAVEEAMKGHREKAAKLFAYGLAMILGAIVPLAILCCISRTAPRLIKSQSVRFMVGKLMTEVQSSRIVTAAQARGIGLTAEEFEAICSATRGTIQILRGCNPNRVTAIERSGGLGNVHFKPGYLKDFKSLKKGPAGEYAVESKEMEKYIRGIYDIVNEGGRLRLRARRESTSTRPKLDRTRPVPDLDKKTGEEIPDSWGAWLDNHILEEIVVDGTRHYAIKHPDGKPFVPDIDRLMYAEIGPTGMLGRSGEIRGQKWLANDDPREVMYWNNRISQAISRITGKKLDWRGLQHGKSADFHSVHKTTGEVGPGWPKRDDAGIYHIENEVIVLTVDGAMFVTDWNGLATFIKAIELLRIKFPWAKSIVEGTVKI